MDNAPAFTAGAGNDTFTAQDVDVSGTQTQTFGALDALDGGAGNNTFNLYDQTNAISFAGSNVTNIETVNVEGGAATTLNTTSWTGLQTLNINQSVGALAVTASASQDVNTTDTAGAINIVGGKNVSVTDATAATAITVGDGAPAGDAKSQIKTNPNLRTLFALHQYENKISKIRHTNGIRFI